MSKCPSVPYQMPYLNYPKSSRRGSELAVLLLDLTVTEIRLEPSDNCYFGYVNGGVFPLVEVSARQSVGLVQEFWCSLYSSRSCVPQ